MEPLRSFHQFNKPPMKPQLPKGRFHCEFVIPSAQPCGISIFGLGLGLELELRLFKKMSTEPPRRHHGFFVEPWRHHGCFTEPSRSLRGAFAEPPEIRQIMTSPHIYSQSYIEDVRRYYSYTALSSGHYPTTPEIRSHL